MSTDSHQPRQDGADVQGWLDGLAGRQGTGPGHDEGKVLRGALTSEESIDLPPWSEIVTSAGLDEQERGAAPAVPTTGRTAANRDNWFPAVGLAAALLLAVGVGVVYWQQEPQTTLRGGSTNPSAAVWRVANPAQAANDLAVELRTLGAAVEVQASATSTHLTIRAPAGAVTAVNQRLAPLEAAVDAQGYLVIEVRDP